MNLNNKTAIITGASRGIGAATARQFAAAGVNLVLAARSTQALEALGDTLGGKIRTITCDVSRYEDLQAAVDLAQSAFGGLDIMINNAGVIEPVATLAHSDPADWGRAIDINLKGIYHGMRAALPIMTAAGGGTVLSIGSGAAQRPLEGWSHYCASKAGALMLTEALHLEAHAQGIRAISLSPGTVATQMQREIKASGVNPVSTLAWSDHIPPEWPARALLWMCSEEADMFLGQEVSLRDPAIRARLNLQAKS